MKVQLESNLQELARAREIVREAAIKMTDRKMPPDKIEELQLAVTEAVTNVIKHAYDGESGHRIEFQMETVADGIQVVIHHWGKGFDPVSAAAPVFDGSQEGGFGLFIISKCVDFFAYSTDKRNRNTIRLIKNLNK